MSILVELLSCFKDKPENIATRGLHAVLKQRECRLGLQDLLRSRINWDLSITAINAQVSQGSNGQPDLEGVNAFGCKVFFCEVKFWAGLTDNQPLGYIEELTAGGLLLFIAPKTRRAALWRELQSRVRDRYGLIPDTGSFQLKVNERYLALLSGPDLLQALAERTTRSGFTEISADILQLQALSSAYDVPDLLPMSEEELTTSLLPRTILGLRDLPRKIADEAAQRLNAKPWDRDSGPYSNLQLGRLKGWVIFSLKNWKKYERSPIWFEANRSHVTDPGDWEVIERVFAERGGQNQPLSSEEYNGSISVPLRVRPNALEADVIDDIVDQLQSLADRIGNISIPGPSDVSA